METSEQVSADRISEVRISHVRCIRELSLKLGSFTVLIGPNGSGKSTILEMIELLRLLGETSGWEQPFFRDHGGLAPLLQRGERTMRLGVAIHGGEAPLEYHVRIAEAPAGFMVDRETLVLGPGPGRKRPVVVIRREPGTEASYLDAPSGAMKPIPNLSNTALAIHSFGQFPPSDAVTRLIGVLRGIAVHVPFDVRAPWTSPEAVPALRKPNVLRTVDRLDRFGGNLANVWHRLKNDFGPNHWQDTMLEVRAGLGADIEDVGTQADPGGGQVGLKIRFANKMELPAYALSDGMLVYLAFVALSRLPDTSTSLLAFDEPEAYLHPELMARVVGLLEEMARARPVLLATHSDRVLDVLSDPAGSVVLCELGPDRMTKLTRPDPAALEGWLRDYRGLGQLRAAGYEGSVFTKEEARDTGGKG